MSNILLQDLMHAVQRLGMPQPGARVVVGVSGGADSVALLHGLVELNARHRLGWRLHVAHYNHRLRGAESDGDERFVRRLATHLGVPLAVVRAKRPRGCAKVGEDELRAARYRFLYELARKHAARFVAVAHTLDDQAETVLMRVVRGAGIRGLGAMREKRRLFPTPEKGVQARGKSPAAPVWLVRPFLCVSRKQILQHLKEAGIGFREDSSNRDVRYVRNFVRTRIMPLLHELNPAVPRALCDLATSARQCSDFVDFAAAEAARFISPKRLKDRTMLKVCGLRQLPPAVRSAVIEREIERLSDEEFTSAHRAAVESLIGDAAGTKVVELAGGLRTRRVYGLLSLEKASAVPSRDRKGAVAAPSHSRDKPAPSTSSGQALSLSKGKGTVVTPPRDTTARSRSRLGFETEPCRDTARARCGGPTIAGDESRTDTMPTAILKVPGATSLPSTAISIRTALLSGRKAAKVVSEVLARKRVLTSRSRVAVARERARTDQLAPATAPTRAVAPRRTGVNTLAAFSEEASPLRIEHLDADRLEFPLAVRTWRAGDRFRPLGQANAKKLQDFFVDRKVPRESRRRIPLVSSGDEIVWIAGMGIADSVKLTAHTVRVLRLGGVPAHGSAGT